MGVLSRLGIILFAALAMGCGGGGTDPAPALRARAQPRTSECGYVHVYVTVQQVQAHGPGGWTDLGLASPRQIDLAANDVGVLQALGLAPLGPGRYTGLRLTLAANQGIGEQLANSVQPSAAALQPLATPGAQHAGLLLHETFEVPAGQQGDLVVQGCLPIVGDGAPGYLLRPSIQVLSRMSAPAPVGEFRINSISPITAVQPYSASLRGGGFVVVWQSGAHVWYRVFADQATPLDVQQQVAAPGPGGRESRPSLASLADGGFVIAWTWVTADGANGDIYFRRYTARGAPVGDAIRANSSASNWQDSAGVAGLADGSHVVTWERWAPFTGRSAVWARRYASTGAPLSTEFRVNPSAMGQSDGKPMALGSGFVVTWRGQDTFMPSGGGTEGLFFQRFDATGEPVGAASLVNETTAGSQHAASSAPLRGGGFVVTWAGHDQPGGESVDVYARRFDANGTPPGGEFRVNTTITGDQTWPMVAGLADGGFVVTWLSMSLLDGKSEIDLQRYDSGGTPVGGEVRANTTQNGRPVNSTITALLDGGHVAIWLQVYEGGLGLIQDILAQRFGASGAPV